MDLQVLKQDDVDKAPEILVYFWIETLGDFIQCMKRAYRLHGANAVVLDDASKAREDQQALVDMLKQREGFAFADHDEYMRWYRWWNNWHRRELSEEQWDELSLSLEWDGTQTDESFSLWRPEGDWRAVREDAS